MTDPYGDGNGPLENVVPFSPRDNERMTDTYAFPDPLHNFDDKTLIQALFRRGLLKVACASEIVSGEIDAQCGSDEDFQQYVKAGLAKRLGIGLAEEGLIVNEKTGTGQGKFLHEDQAHMAYVAVLVPGDKRNGA